MHSQLFEKKLKRLRGFTLIELLIVIAIILILIAIALPNFLEAQIRARVTKAKGELRSLGIAQEAYYLDFNIYPAESEDNPYGRPRNEQGLYWLTSPIPYITSIPVDPFGTQATGDGLTVYETGGAEAGASFIQCFACLRTWVIYTLGPDTPGTDVVSDHPHYGEYDDGSVDQYSPTNGTKSRGDIFLYGGDPFFIGVSGGSGNIGIYKKAPPGSLDDGLIVNGIYHLHKMPPGL
jgi:type II secretion system protein G